MALPPPGRIAPAPGRTRQNGACVPEPCPKDFSNVNLDPGASINPILQMQKPRPGEIKQLAWGHIAA